MPVSRDLTFAIFSVVFRDVSHRKLLERRLNHRTLRGARDPVATETICYSAVHTIGWKTTVVRVEDALYEAWWAEDRLLPGLYVLGLYVTRSRNLIASNGPLITTRF